MPQFQSTSTVGHAPDRLSCGRGWTLIAACCLIAGCSKSDLVPVGGLVKNEEQVVSGGSVVFTPIGEGQPAIGPIQSDGTFQLTSFSPNDGAKVGQYRVSVAGKRDPQTDRTGPTYVAPPDLVFEVVAGKENKFLIHIRKRDGWQTAAGG
jgi:hypothetical protein